MCVPFPIIVCANFGLIAIFSSRKVQASYLFLRQFATLNPSFNRMSGPSLDFSSVYLLSLNSIFFPLKLGKKLSDSYLLFGVTGEWNGAERHLTWRSVYISVLFLIILCLPTRI